MKQTLTTERMAEIAKLAIRLQQISSCAAVTSSGETVLHHTHVDEILSALHDVTAELLANREAQPVGYTSAAALDLLSHGHVALIHKDAENYTFIEEEHRDIVPLFTYSPAVASGEDCWSCGKFFTYAQHSECDGYCPHCDAPVDLDEGEEGAAPPAPAVPHVTAIPEAATLTNINQLCPLDSNLSQTDFATGWNDCLQHALTHDGLPPVIKGVHAAAQGWNACRAAMLAQPVSQGCKLPPHAYRELVNALRDTAVKYSGTDQLRERLNTALSQFIEPDHPHTRTAAPEGGNGA